MPLPLRNKPAARANNGRLAGRRGFTLVELMVVVIIIAIVSALAIPVIGKQLRERRIHQGAQEIAIAYRNGRSLAMARGAAVLVRFDPPNGGIIVREAVQGGACPDLPATQCNRTTVGDWDTAGLFEPVTGVNPGRYSQPGAPVVFEARDPGGANVAFLDVCFTPLGRAFFRQSAASTFQPLTGVPQVDVYRGAVGAPMGVVRTISILPTGAARVSTRALP